MTSGFDGQRARDQTALPFVPGSSFQDCPASTVLYTPDVHGVIAFHAGVPGAGRSRIDFERVQRARQLSREWNISPGSAAIRGSEQKAVVRARDDKSAAISELRGPVPHRRRTVLWFAIRQRHISVQRPCKMKRSSSAAGCSPDRSRFLSHSKLYAYGSTLNRPAITWPITKSCIESMQKTLVAERLS